VTGQQVGSVTVTASLNDKSDNALISVIEKIVVTVVNYFGNDTPPEVVEDGFVEDAQQAIDRSTSLWTNVPAELSGQTYLLTAREDRDNTADVNTVFYRINISAACTVFCLIKASSPPAWIASDGWQSTSLRLMADSDNYAAYKRYFPAGDIDLKRQMGTGQGTGYVFEIGAGPTVEKQVEISSKKGINITAFPNPFNRNVTIKIGGYPQLGPSGYIMILNVQGRVVNKEDLSKFRVRGDNRLTYNFDAGKLPNGIYIVKLISKGKTLNLPVVYIK
jgi:hypothetical protein